MSKAPSTDRKKPWLSCSFTVILTLALVGVLLIGFRHWGMRKIRAWDRIQVGTVYVAEEHGLGDPVARVRVGTCESLYYEFSLGTDPCEELDVANVDQLEDLPWCYGYLELLLDQEGRLIAKDWQGECYFQIIDDQYVEGGVKKGAEVLRPHCFD